MADWELIHQDGNDKTERLAIDGGHLYRTVCRIAPSDIGQAALEGVALVFVAGVDEGQKVFWNDMQRRVQMQQDAEHEAVRQAVQAAVDGQPQETGSGEWHATSAFPAATRDREADDRDMADALADAKQESGQPNVNEVATDTGGAVVEPVIVPPMGEPPLIKLKLSEIHQPGTQAHTQALADEAAEEAAAMDAALPPDHPAPPEASAINGDDAPAADPLPETHQ